MNETSWTSITRVAIMADVLDAADPTHDHETRLAAIGNALATDPAFTAVAAVEMLHGLLTAYRQQAGDTATDELMRQMRAAAAQTYTDHA